MCDPENACKCPGAVVWQQIKTLRLLIERLEQIGDRSLELLQKTETIFQEQRAAIIEEYLKKRLKELDKK